nr:Na(+)-translocating NADH-quinone reductase subunit A [Saprospiraceae bacterium]
MRDILFRNWSKGVILFFSLAMFPTNIFAQSSSGSLDLLSSIIIATVIIVFGAIIFVTDSLLQMEGRRQLEGKDAKVDSSLFPKYIGDASELPSYIPKDRYFKLRRGFDINLEGKPENKIVETPFVSKYSVLPTDFRGIAPIPKITPEEGDGLLAGDELFFDKRNPEIKFVSPVSGKFAGIVRGPKRAIHEVTVIADEEIKYKELPELNLDSAERSDIVNFLKKYGGWVHLRQRPFDIIPDPEDVPRDIFISTFDTAPLAPDLNFAVQGEEAAFQTGIDLLNKLTDGRVHLGMDGRGKEIPSRVFLEAKNVEKYWFTGKHPAGNVGVQIHHINPIKKGDMIWYLHPHDVIVLGKMITERRYNTERLMAMCGAEIETRAYMRSRPGAQVGELLSNITFKNENVRLISGDVLTGNKKEKEGFVGFFDDQVTVILEGDYYEPFGWLLPQEVRPSLSPTFPGFIFPDMEYRADTNSHGERRAFVVTGQYEKVLPMDIYPQHLMKAILTNDFERMEGLGIYELSEEDIAICEFVCTSKMPLQQILREGLEIVNE